MEQKQTSDKRRNRYRLKERSIEIIQSEKEKIIERK